MKHKNKLKLARKLRSGKEVKEKVPIFQTENWEKRRQGIKEKVENQIKKAKDRKKLRIKSGVEQSGSSAVS